MRERDLLSFTDNLVNNINSERLHVLLIDLREKDQALRGSIEYNLKRLDRCVLALVVEDTYLLVVLVNNDLAIFSKDRIHVSLELEEFHC